MKRIFTFLAAIVLAAGMFGQAPEKMSYQAVVRNSSDQLVTNQSVGMQISILEGSTSGTPVYVETQTPTTNTNGLVSIEIAGSGATVVSGVFANIDWAANTYYIKTEIDPSGGTSYSISGTSQLLSVPYALYAKSAGSAIEIDGDVGNEIQSLSFSAIGDTLFISKGNWVIIPGISKANTGVELISLHGPVLAFVFDDDPTNHNINIASDGDYFYTVNGGTASSGRIKKYTRDGALISTVNIMLDFRSIMYNKADGLFYVSTYGGSIYRITNIETGTYQLLFTSLLDYNQASAALSDDGLYIYGFQTGTLKKYRLSDGVLVETINGLSHGTGNFGGDGAVAVDPNYLYTWNAVSRTVYIYNHAGVLQQTMVLDNGDLGPSLSFVDGYLFVSRNGNYSIGTWYGYNIRRNSGLKSAVVQGAKLEATQEVVRPESDSMIK